MFLLIFICTCFLYAHRLFSLSATNTSTISSLKKLPVVAAQASTQDAVVHVDDCLELGPEPLPEPGRALNVGEHQAHHVAPQPPPLPPVPRRLGRARRQSFAERVHPPLFLPLRRGRTAAAAAATAAASAAAVTMARAPVGAVPSAGAVYFAQAHAASAIPKAFVTIGHAAPQISRHGLHPMGRGSMLAVLRFQFGVCTAVVGV